MVPDRDVLPSCASVVRWGRVGRASPHQCALGQGGALGALAAPLLYVKGIGGSPTAAALSIRRERVSLGP